MEKRDKLHLKTKKIEKLQPKYGVVISSKLHKQERYLHLDKINMSYGNTLKIWFPTLKQLEDTLKIYFKEVK